MSKFKFYFRRSLQIIRQEGVLSFVRKAGRKLRSFYFSKVDQRPVVEQPLFDFSYEDLKENQRVLEAQKARKVWQIKTINWFLPYFAYPMGGVNTIFRFAEYFRDQKGVESRFIICDNPSATEKEMRGIIKKYFPSFPNARVFTRAQTREEIAQLPASDAGVATRWDTSYALLKYNRTRGKFYFAQDFEPLFYPAGSEYALADATYRFGFQGICNTRGVLEEYRRYNPNAIFFTPSVDRSCYYPSLKRKTNGSIRIFFFARPSTPRNAFELGVLALKKIKEKYGEKVDIVTAGEDYDESWLQSKGLKGTLRNLGLLKTLGEVADLYRTCDIGLVFMFTKHPSYQPLEFMASGMATVTNYNPSNFWLLKDGENCLLSEPSVSCVAQRINELIENPRLREKIVKGGLETIESLPTWDEEIEKVWRFMTKQSL